MKHIDLLKHLCETMSSYATEMVTQADSRMEKFKENEKKIEQYNKEINELSEGIQSMKSEIDALAKEKTKYDDVSKLAMAMYHEKKING